MYTLVERNRDETDVLFPRSTTFTRILFARSATFPFSDNFIHRQSLCDNFIARSSTQSSSDNFIHPSDDRPLSDNSILRHSSPPPFNPIQRQSFSERQFHRLTIAFSPFAFSPEYFSSIVSARILRHHHLPYPHPTSHSSPKFGLCRFFKKKSSKPLSLNMALLA